MGLGAFLFAKRNGQTASRNETGIPTRDPESHLFLVAHSQNGDELRVQTVAGNIAGVTKLDHPVSELVVHVFDRPPDTWLLFQHFDPLANRSWLSKFSDNQRRIGTIRHIPMAEPEANYGCKILQQPRAEANVKPSRLHNIRADSNPSSEPVNAEVQHQHQRR